MRYTNLLFTYLLTYFLRQEIPSPPYSRHTCPRADLYITLHKVKSYMNHRVHRAPLIHISSALSWTPHTNLLCETTDMEPVYYMICMFTPQHLISLEKKQIYELHHTE